MKINTKKVLITTCLLFLFSFTFSERLSKGIKLCNTYSNGFLILKHPNYSHYKLPTRKPWSKSDISIRTNFYRIKFDPQTGLVDTSDYTYASSSGVISHHKGHERSCPYGTAFGCEAPNKADGVGKIDLRGTGYKVDDTFQHRGYLSAGRAKVSSNGQVIDLYGGGYCGWIAPSKARDEKMAYIGGKYLKLSPIDDKNCVKDVNPPVVNPPVVNPPVVNPPVVNPPVVNPPVVNPPVVNPPVVDPPINEADRPLCKKITSGYLELNHTTFSQYTLPTRKPWKKTDSTLRTTFTKIKVDENLMVNTADYTHSTSKGYVSHHESSKIPLGTAFGCEKIRHTDGIAVIDLRGTGYAIDPSTTFQHRGFHSNGAASFSDNRQKVTLRGGGYCGWIAPTVAQGEKEAHAGGNYIKLQKIHNDPYCKHYAMGLIIPEENVTLRGKIIDAQTGNIIPKDVLASIKVQFKSKSSSVHNATVKDGIYEVSLPKGTYERIATLEGYIENKFERTYNESVNEEQPLSAIVLSKKLPEGNLRIVLTWGKDPSDLDCHLITRSNEEIYFANKESKDKNISLDVDDLNGHGPETITIKKPIPESGYYVKKFSGQGDLIQSEANVKIYMGDQEMQTYKVPTEGVGDVWHVFNIVPGFAGNPKFMRVNKIQNKFND